MRAVTKGRLGQIAPGVGPLALGLAASVLLSGCGIAVNFSSSASKPSRQSSTSQPTPSATPTPSLNPEPSPSSAPPSASLVTPGYLGVDFQSFNDDGTQGCKLTAVVSNTPASSGGLTAGDVLQAATAAGTPTPIQNCNNLTQVLYQEGPGATVTFTYVHQTGFIFTSWQGGSATVTLGTPPCPKPITGQISGAGNRIPLQIELVGPSGSYPMSAILDTGGVNAFLPDGDLTGAGFTSTGSYQSGLAGWTGQVNTYSIPAADLLVLDHGVYVPLATGTLTVNGVPPAAFQTGVEPLVGPDVLQQGAALATSGATWTLTPACG